MQVGGGVSSLSFIHRLILKQNQFLWAFSHTSWQVLVLNFDAHLAHIHILATTCYATRSMSIFFIGQINLHKISHPPLSLIGHIYTDNIYVDINACSHYVTSLIRLLIL